MAVSTQTWDGGSHSELASGGAGPERRAPSGKCEQRVKYGRLVLIVDASTLRSTLSIDHAIDALAEDLARQVQPEVPPRMHIENTAGALLVMPAVAEAAAGIKLVSIVEGNPDRGLARINGVYILLDGTTLVPVCAIDGSELTRIRTAAVSGLATRLLAAADARHLVVFGSGVQAEAHVRAMLAVREITAITIVGRSVTADVLVTRLRTELGVVAGRGQPSAVAEADIVCTCTSSSETLFDGGLLPPGSHVNAIGAYRPHSRELDDAALRDAMIVIDDPAAITEAGELAVPLRSGVIEPDAVAGTLRDAVLGRISRSSDAQRTVFKSVGAAWEDLAVARAAWQRIKIRN